MKRKEGVFVVVQAAIVVAVLALVALPLQSPDEARVSTSSIASEGPPASLSGVALDSLRLSLVLNATSMRQQGAITGQVEVVNISNQSLTLPTLGRSQNITEWSNYNNICPSDDIIGYAVFDRHFTAENISSAGNPLRLVPLMSMTCPGPVGLTAVRFLPNASQDLGSLGAGQPQQFFWRVATVVNATTLFCNTTASGNGFFSCSWAEPGLVGYWNYSTPNEGNSGFTSPAFVRFSPGEFTVVAWDDWNQYVYSTFVVLAGSNSPAD
jgi:hypothetical protein